MATLTTTKGLVTAANGTVFDVAVDVDGITRLRYGFLVDWVYETVDDAVADADNLEPQVLKYLDAAQTASSGSCSARSSISGSTAHCGMAPS